jgi:hypothetical protein
MPKLMAIAEGILLEKVLFEGWPLSRKKNRLGQALFVLSGLLTLVAISFLIIAFYAWVQSQYPPETAALLTAGAVLGLALLVGFAGHGIIHQRRLHTEAAKTNIQHTIKSTIAALDDELGDQVRDNPITAVLLAALAGYVASETIL